MLKRHWMKTAALAVAALLMSGGLAQAQSEGAQAPGSGSTMGAGSAAGTPDPAYPGSAGTGTPSGMGMGSGMGSGMGMEPGRTPGSPANTGTNGNGNGAYDTQGMSPQDDPYAQRHARRSRATVVPNIVNDNVYPDPNNPGRDDPALKDRRDAKRAARGGAISE